MNEISGRFIELGLDDHHSDYGQELQAKQVKFMREFERLPGKIFEDNTHSTLHLPKSEFSKEDTEATLEQEDDAEFNKQFDALGHQIHQLHEVMFHAWGNQFKQVDFVQNFGK